MPTESEQQEQQPHPAGEAQTAGALLRRAREARGLDEKQVADQLRITVHYVKAIEADRYDKLPGVIFARGYLKSYASLLNLDPADIVARYEAATGTAQPGSRQPEMTQSAISSGGNNGNTGMRWAMASAAAFVVLFVGIWVISGPTVESTGVADRGADRAAPANTDRARSNSLTSVQRAIADEPTLPVPEGPAERIATGSPLLPTPDPAEPEADRSGAATQIADVDTDPVAPAAAEAAVSAAVIDSNRDAAQQVAPEPGASADAAPAATAETAAPAADSADASREQAWDQAPAGVTRAASESAEELVAINVLQGDNGERIIEVDAAGPDVLQISFSGESWVEVNDADQRLIYRDLRESGDVLEVSGNAPFNILLGDAPLTSLRLNGSAIDVSDEIRIDNSARLTVGL